MEKEAILFRIRKLYWEINNNTDTQYEIRVLAKKNWLSKVKSYKD